MMLRDLIPSANSIFNSAAVPFDGRFVGVFRVDNKKRKMNLYRSFSYDGINWTLDHEPIVWQRVENQEDSAMCTKIWGDHWVNSLSTDI